MTYRSGPTSLFLDEDLSAAVARQRLSTVKTKEPAAPAEEAVRAGRAVRLAMVEMERVTGFSRQTLYNHLDRARKLEPSREELEIQILMVLASEKRMLPASTIAARLELQNPASVLTVILEIERGGLCGVEREDGSTSLLAFATDQTFEYLRDYFESIYFRRPDAYMVSFDARGHDTNQLVAELKRVLSNPEDYALMEREVAPSTMVGPELGFYVYAATVPRVYQIAHRVWAEMMGDPNAVAPIREVIPPGERRPIPSEILDGFLDHLIAVNPEVEKGATAARDAYPGGIEKTTLAGRCVRQAAKAMRRARKIKAEPGEIHDGESAWTEVEIAEAVKLDPPFEDVQEAARKAVWLASNNIGFFPGGGMASMGESKPIVGGQPTNKELIEMAEAAGEAVGEASKLGLIDPVEAMLEISLGTAPDSGSR